MRLIVLLMMVLNTLTVQGQTYPSFGPEMDVTINGLTFDAMEPFISPDGKFLFFNNLNDGINTKLYYAEKVNDSLFNFREELIGANQNTPPHLDGVPDLDSLNNFYWTSTRNYPAELNNLFHGTFNSGGITNIGRVQGDFNKNIPGWLIMDHGISLDGQFLYYINARFAGNNCQGACETEIGIAQKVNDSTFNTVPESDAILSNIKDPSYIYYAPTISSDNLELYYTRYKSGEITINTRFEICVSVRNSSTESFSTPKVLFSDLIGDLIEAPTLTKDKQIIYYHRKITGSHKIVMRYRESTSSNIPNIESESPFTIFPNPTNRVLHIQTKSYYQHLKISVLNMMGAEVITLSNQTYINVNSLSPGAYFLKLVMDGETRMMKFIKI